MNVERFEPFTDSELMKLSVAICNEMERATKCGEYSTVDILEKLHDDLSTVISVRLHRNRENDRPKR